MHQRRIKSLFARPNMGLLPSCYRGIMLSMPHGFTGYTLLAGVWDGELDAEPLLHHVERAHASRPLPFSVGTRLLLGVMRGECN